MWYLKYAVVIWKWEIIQSSTFIRLFCINEKDDVIVCLISETEKVVTIGQLEGKLQSGAESIACFREDKRNKASPS